MKAAAIVAALLEAVSLWTFSFIRWGAFGAHEPAGPLANWGMRAALLIHLPPLAILSLFSGGGLAYWPTLFLGGYAEFFLLIGVVI
jgi:hypothetical protein